MNGGVGLLIELAGVCEAMGVVCEVGGGQGVRDGGGEGVLRQGVGTEMQGTGERVKGRAVGQG